MRYASGPARRIASLIVGTVTVATVAAQRPALPGPAVFRPGDFHGNEAPVIAGGGWLALVRYGSRDALEPVDPRSASVRDDLLDDDAGPFTGRHVFVPGLDSSPSALFLVRGIPELRGRDPVPEALVDCGGCGQSAPDLALVRRVTLSLAGARWMLQVDPADPSLPLDARPALRLVQGDRSQVLYHPTEVDEPSFEVIWAGDLDGDGRLDLFMNVSHHYNVTRHVLYLSAGAGPGNLVRLVAEHTTTGC